MYVSPWMQAATLPTRWRVAGVSCGPLSVWHAFILGARGNAFVCDDPARMDMDAAAELLLYASLNYADGRRLFVEPRFRARALRSVCKTIAGREWDDVRAACAMYCEECRRVPGHKQPEGDSKGGKGKGRSAAAPFAWILVEHLSAGNPARIESAWDTPYATACCLFDAARDIRGEDDTLETLAESERFDAVVERRKQGAA